ncbi:bifunctional methionine sulfoxide reductase B/A protein [Pedobacter sp. BAL39]|uniref:hypothetical protein n=1 Tax=Pedobacter sp. BAL39 TaxID=391596 RepID=UPI000155A5C2|nr:hypothetical protein [Pedobacter sp. BAL39]EDM33988.1 bifunctional methionine sulfoxide reductase B/A protein [Pedobacter sp. BAL39]
MKEEQKNEGKRKENKPEGSTAFQPQGPRDGFDNTGTQGYDSLKDDGYIGSAPGSDTHEDGTGSSSEDFHPAPGKTGSDQQQSESADK